MAKTMAQAENLQRWSEEVARDPKSLAFLPLARAYRKRGLRDAARAICLRGLEMHPANVDAHGLLALLYLDEGDHQRAADEWSIVLRIDPDNFEALRGMGFCCLEQDRLSRARQMLERAAQLRPDDSTVQEALGLLGTRQEIVEKGLAPHDPLFSDDPWAGGDSGPIFMLAQSSPEKEQPESAVDNGARRDRATGATSDVAPAAAAAPQRNVIADIAAATGATAVAGAPSAPTPSAPTPSAPTPAAPTMAAPAAATRPAHVNGLVPLDPTILFDDLLSSGPLLGALLIDVNGRVLAGRLTEAMRGDPAVLGAVLGGAIGEATRTALHLALGAWRGIMLDAEHALLHLTPAGSDAVLMLAARRDAPAGWLVRAASHAAVQAQQYLEEYA